MREMLNVSKHTGLLQVEVSVFVDEMIITCWCVCSVWQIWWDCITLYRACVMMAWGLIVPLVLLFMERMDDAVFDIDDTCGHFSGQRCQLILCRMRVC